MNSPASIVFMIMVAIFIGIQFVFLVKGIKRVKPGFALVVICPRAKVVRTGAVFVWPLIQAFMYVPMTALSVRVKEGSLKACVIDDDGSVIKAVERFPALTLEGMSAHLSSLLRDVSDTGKVDKMLNEYGMKRII